MPFTFSHPALILPLTYLSRKWYSLTGLVIGSLTPDFEYFIRMKVQSEYSHTVGGLFWFDLPLGLLLAFAYHMIARDALLNNLPIALKSRLGVFRLFDWNNYFRKSWIIIIYSILIGASSHLLWDSFTHEDGYFVNVTDGLKSSIFLAGLEIPIYKLLQHLSSFMGVLIIAFAVWQLPTNKAVECAPSSRYWFIVVFIAVCILALRMASGLTYQQYGNVVVSGIAAGIISLIIVPLLAKNIKHLP